MKTLKSDFSILGPNGKSGNLRATFQILTNNIRSDNQICLLVCSDIDSFENRLKKPYTNDHFWIQMFKFQLCEGVGF